MTSEIRTLTETRLSAAHHLANAVDDLAALSERHGFSFLAYPLSMARIAAVEEVSQIQREYRSPEPASTLANESSATDAVCKARIITTSDT